MKRSKTHLSTLDRRWSRAWARLALGVSLVLLSASTASLLALAWTGPEYGLASHGEPTHVGASRAASLVQHPPEMVLQPDTNSSSPLTESITSTAFLPIALNGYPPAYLWTGEVVATYPNCTLTRLFGFVLNEYGEPEGDVWVHYWADNYDGDWDKSSWEAQGDHNWDGTLDNRPRQVAWYVCVVPEKKSWDCQSNTVVAPTSSNCETGVQVYHIKFTRNQ